MLVAALIILIIAVLLLLAGIFGGGGDATLDLGAFNVDANSSAVFFLGMLTLLLFVIGLGAFRSGVRRANAHRRDRKKVGELSDKLDTFKEGQQQESRRDAEREER